MVKVDPNLHRFRSVAGHLSIGHVTLTRGKPRFTVVVAKLRQHISEER